MFLKLNNNPKLSVINEDVVSLEYLESTGTQYIDTEFKPNQDTRVICCFNDSSDNNEFIFGAIHTSNSNQFGYLDGITASQGIRYGSQSVLLEAEHNTIQTVDGNKNVWSLNGNTASASYINFTCNYNMYIFTCNNAGSTTTLKTNLKIYYFKIYDNDVLVRDFIPALDPNNVACMYDKVSERYFYNKGTGSFIEGNIQNIIADQVALSIDKLFIKDCNKLKSYFILKHTINIQLNNNNVILSKIRLNIGNISGSLSELMQYSSIAGFNDNGENQNKPRLIGTWTVTDWHTQDQITNAQSIFDGLTIMSDTIHLINFNNLAVQTLDSTKPNYNPAVAIVLQSNNVGITVNSPVVNGGGRWFLTKSDAASVTTVNLWFQNAGDITDNNNIVSDTVKDYRLTTFDEFKYFTGVTSIVGYSAGVKNGALSMPYLTSIKLPTSLTTFAGSAWDYSNAFANCTELLELDLSNVTSFKAGLCANCTKLKSVILNPNITTLPASSFQNCTNLETLEGYDNLLILDSNSLRGLNVNKLSQLDHLPPNITKLNGGHRTGCLYDSVVGFTEIPTSCEYIGGHFITSKSGIVFLHFSRPTPPTIASTTFDYWIRNNPQNRIYIGDGISQTDDENLLNLYLADTNWASYSNILDTWYNYLHPTT